MPEGPRPHLPLPGRHHRAEEQVDGDDGQAAPDSEGVPAGALTAHRVPQQADEGTVSILSACLRSSTLSTPAA